MNSGSDWAPTDYKIEFRCHDDSWYDVRLKLCGENLTVHYCDFPHQHELFNATAYGSPEKIEELEKRFRPVSKQIQDGECSKVVEGMMVCASHAFSQNELHFYDAVIEEVRYKEHSVVEGEEECLCTFILFWQHGPNAGNLTTANIADICLIQSSANTHPLLTSFLKMARRKFGIISRNSCSDSEGCNPTYSTGSCREEIQSLSLKQRSTSAQHEMLVMNYAMQSLTSEGRIINCETIESDTDIGGQSSHHIILVDNLEKQLTASTIVEFIHKQTAITPQAYVFPTLSLEPYTRGIIVLKCRKKFGKICDFLDDPNHIIISSRGRPWVTTEKISRHDAFRTSLVTLLLKSQNQLNNGKVGIGSQVKLVYLGTQEYEMAKRRRDVYVDFFDHLQRLHRSLTFEENEILKQSHAG